MINLTLEHLLQLHTLIIETTGGSAGLRDLGRLEAAIATQTQHVFGEELYPSASEKAAALMRSIVADHPFVDGNKRTAVLATLTFLELNGSYFQARSGELEDFAVEVAVARLDVPAIAAWLKAHSK